MTVPGGRSVDRGRPTCATARGARRIPPDAIGAGVAVRVPSAAAPGERCTAAGRAALAAEVSGRSGMRMVSLDTVGRLRIGAEATGATA